MLIGQNESGTNMLEKFEDFFDHKEEVIATAAKFLAEVKEKYEVGDLTRDEFEELSADATEIGEMKELADDLDRRKAVTDAFSALKIIVSFIPI